MKNTVVFETAKSSEDYYGDVYVDEKYFTQPRKYQLRGVWNLLKEIIRRW